MFNLIFNVLLKVKSVAMTVNGIWMFLQIDIKSIYQSNLSFDFWNQRVKKRRTVVLLFTHM